jgi:hypothetical protein
MSNREYCRVQGLLFFAASPQMYICGCLLLIKNHHKQCPVEGMAVFGHGFKIELSREQ